MNSRLVFLLLACSLIQGIQSYCIYNKMTDGASFDIVQSYGETIDTKLFKKYMKKDAKECCPYTSWDCSPHPVNDDVVFFKIRFKWPRYLSYDHITQCTSGGALTFYGTENYHWAECTQASGFIDKVDILPYNE